MMELTLSDMASLGKAEKLLAALDADPGKINVLNESSQSLLQLAVAFEHNDLALELIRRGIDVNILDANNATVLHSASARRADDVLDSALKNGARVDIVDKYGNEPLWTAVFNSKGYYRAVELLMRHGANPAHKNRAGKSPLDFAMQIKDNSLIQILELSQHANGH